MQPTRSLKAVHDAEYITWEKSLAGLGDAGFCGISFISVTLICMALLRFLFREKFCEVK